MAIPKAQPTPDTVRTDAANVLGFLQALDAVLPGHVDPELVAFLEGLQGNALSLALLCQALAKEK